MEKDDRRPSIDFRWERKLFDSSKYILIDYFSNLCLEIKYNFQIIFIIIMFA